MVDQSFSDVQKQYLEGFFAAVKQHPFVGTTVEGRITPSPSEAIRGNEALPPESSDETWWGVPLEDLSKEELLKHEQNPLDIYDRIVEYARQSRFPEAGDVYRWKFSGLFYVAPAQDAYMMRVRIPGNVLLSHQLRGLAEIARDWGGGYGDVTTRGNIQIREIKPGDSINCLLKLAEVGLSSKGSGCDNVRNITASPTAGFDPQELIDVRPLAKAMQYYIANHRDLFGLPRKFNICFDGGGAISVVSDTNDIGFKAVRISDGQSMSPGVYFRMLLSGITGHRQFGEDAEVLVKPEECVAVAAAILRVFNEMGDRTNRKKARLKYVTDRLGMKKFLEHVETKLAFPLGRAVDAKMQEAHPPIRHAHIGIHRQKQKGLDYLGVLLPVGRMTARQMEGVADLADRYGVGEIRTTVWQNILLPGIPENQVNQVTRRLRSLGLDIRATSFRAGVVACTGRVGCRYAATDTKGQGAALIRHLESKLTIDLPINIHLTGCPHSCAQHYIGDIGLLGAVVTGPAGGKSEGYHVLVGGGCDDDQAIGRELFKGIIFEQLPALIENMVRVYQARRNRGETFNEFTRRHEIGELQELFGEMG